MLKTFDRCLRFMTLGTLATATWGAGVSPRPVAAPRADIVASTALGTVTTVVVDLDNTGQPTSTVQLFEALAPDTALAQVKPPTDLRVPLPDELGPISPALTDELQAAPGGITEFIIYLADQADLSAAAAIDDWDARGTAVVDTLRQHAAKTQAGLLATLEAQGYQPRPYWIVNAVAVTGDAALAQWAAAQAEVALVAANEVHVLDEPPAVDAEAALAAEDEGIAWGVSQIGAPSAWANWGVRGSGIVVANIDTGVAYTHTALLANYRGWNGSSADHNYNWYDAAAQPPKPAPFDPAGHGTHVMGTMLGGAAGGYTALGVAPAARWIAARGCAGIFCTDTALIDSAQWLLAPTNLAGSLPRPDLRPHIINNSWGKNSEDDWYVGYVAAWNASGIFSVFANGNNGLAGGCGSSGSPGQYPLSFSVGATDADDFVANFSSRGPTSDGRVKPDLSAPGVLVPSAALDGGVFMLSGTSMAAPHVSGAAALLWSANPALIGDLPATQALLTGSAVPRTSGECGPAPLAIPNNVYGWGRLDAGAAVQAARVDVPWLSVPPTITLPANGFGSVTLTLDARQVSAPGTYAARLLVMRGNSLTSLPISFEVLASADAAQLTGHLEDVWSGGAVYGRVQVGDGPLVYTNLGGQFTMTLPLGEYAVMGAATGYISATQPVTVAGDTSATFSLMPDRPHLALNADLPFSATLAFGERYTGTVTLSNAGTQPLSVTASVPPLEWVVDEAGVSGTTLFDIGSAPALPLSDDQIHPEPLALGFSLPIYGQLVSEIYLSSNGWISAQQPSSAAPFATCMTSAGMPGGTLAAFWADLDPSRGGAVRTAAIDAETYVISFEDVPHYHADPEATPPVYSFQIVLHASGAVDFIYGDLGEMPTRWAMGTFQNSARAQSLACYREPTPLAHTRWTLHNQPAASPWLTVDNPNLSLPPGESVDLAVVLKGFGYQAWPSRPYEGYVRLTTNDPTQATVDLAAVAVVGPPALSLWLPVLGR